jgi:hypothetical protein
MTHGVLRAQETLLRKLHPLLAQVLEQHKLMCVKRSTRQPITQDMIDIIPLRMDHQLASPLRLDDTRSVHRLPYRRIQPHIL